MMSAGYIVEPKQRTGSVIHTVRLGQYFYDGLARVIIQRARRPYPCNCGDARHLIRPGDLYMHATDLSHYPKRAYAYWHHDHLGTQRRVIVVDKDGREIASFGSSASR